MNPHLFGTSPGITEYNYLSSFLRTFVDDFMQKAGSRPNPIILSRAHSFLLQFLRSPEVLAKVGFDATFHFKFDIVADPTHKRIIVCLNPLTPVALDCCIALKIPVDESLVVQIRKAYNEALANSNLSDIPRETPEPQ